MIAKAQKQVEKRKWLYSSFPLDGSSELSLNLLAVLQDTLYNHRKHSSMVNAVKGSTKARSEVSPTGSNRVEDVTVWLGWEGIGIRIFIRGCPEGRAATTCAGSEGEGILTLRDAREDVQFYLCRKKIGESFTC